MHNTNISVLYYYSFMYIQDARWVLECLTGVSSRMSVAAKGLDSPFFGLRAGGGRIGYSKPKRLKP